MSKIEEIRDALAQHPDIGRVLVHGIKCSIWLADLMSYYEAAEAVLRDERVDLTLDEYTSKAILAVIDAKRELEK